MLERCAREECGRHLGHDAWVLADVVEQGFRCRPDAPALQHQAPLPCAVPNRVERDGSRLCQAFGVASGSALARLVRGQVAGAWLCDCADQEVYVSQLDQLVGQLVHGGCLSAERCGPARQLHFAADRLHVLDVHGLFRHRRAPRQAVRCATAGRHALAEDLACTGGRERGAALYAIGYDTGKDTFRPNALAWLRVRVPTILAETAGIHSHWTSGSFRRCAERQRPYVGIISHEGHDGVFSN
mmetsp:Transcript_75228/g.244650  ORF Transcript_75228/g.244650 Transcript_75228/m.244650 type:complete len:242 (-) Transcript_75228:588-1313(-)